MNRSKIPMSKAKDKNADLKGEICQICGEEVDLEAYDTIGVRQELQKFWKALTLNCHARSALMEVLEMNESKIEWCDSTWNPVTGCLHGCEYCYARGIAERFRPFDLPRLTDEKQVHDLREAVATICKDGKERKCAYPYGFEPTFHRYRLNDYIAKKGRNIFVCSMADLFGDWVPDSWIEEVFAVCERAPQHDYLFLTKNPERYMRHGVPVGLENLWYGASVTKESEMGRLNHLPEHCRTFVSMEPLLEDLHPREHRLELEGVDWIILGAETGRRKERVLPEWDWIKGIILEADNMGIPVFMKDSLLEIVGEGNMRLEFPRQLQRSEISPKMKKKLYAECAECEAFLKKSDMITLLARSKRGEQPKRFGFMCKDCFRRFCEDLGLDLPELAGMTTKITIELKDRAEKEGGNGEEKRL